ncbi:hypothetical protein EDB86DRAFT_2888292 [Lactarius hatsudake]|nr:hypothetical protein EDB86DRAFT_2888292 [Lactarius hatsudake]
MSSLRLPISKFLKTNSNKIWCFLLDKGTTELRYGEDAFPIVVSLDTDLYELKEKIRGVRFNDLAHVDAARLEVWEYIPDSAKIINPKPGELRALINSIDYSNENIVRRVPPGQMVAALIHTEYKVLIVLVPSAMHAQASAGGSGGSGQRQYSDVFIQASENRRFNMSDLYTNQVTRRIGNIPLFVLDYRNRLERKRPVSSTDFEELAASFGPLVSENFTDISTLTQEVPPQESLSFEVRHMLDMCFIEDRAWWDGHKETFVNGLFFFKLQSHLLKLGLESTFPKPWPFNLIVKYRGQHCPYAPKSDYSIWIHLFPRLLVEVNSANPRHGQQLPDDHIRLLLQGSSSIRTHEPYQKKQGCRLRFARVLYNLADYLQVEADSGHFNDSDEVSTALEALQKYAHGPSFTSKRGHSPSTEHENDSPDTSSPKRQRQQDSDALEGAGYELMPDVIEDDNDTFEPWYKVLPPHIYCVRRNGDPEKREYIAKRIRHHSNEMLEIIKLKVTTLIVFPKLGSISEELQFGGRVLHGRLIDLSRDLARGLTFLHNHNIAHLDVNPSNLGFTDNYRLQVFDFDISVQVNDEDEQINDYLGTEGWMAPEIGTRDGPRQLYSPIRADKYSCGRVFRVFADTNGEVDEGLGQFADKLMHPNPSERPHLIEWCGPDDGATLTQTNSAEMMDITMVAEDEAMVAEDKVMASKRPRVGHGGEGLYQVPM